MEGNVTFTRNSSGSDSRSDLQKHRSNSASLVGGTRLMDTLPTPVELWRKPSGVLKVLEVLKVLKVLEVLEVLKVLKVLKVHLEHEQDRDPEQQKPAASGTGRLQQDSRPEKESAGLRPGSLGSAGPEHTEAEETPTNILPTMANRPPLKALHHVPVTEDRWSLPLHLADRRHIEVNQMFWGLTPAALTFTCLSDHKLLNQPPIHKTGRRSPKKRPARLLTMQQDHEAMRKGRIPPGQAGLFVAAAANGTASTKRTNTAIQWEEPEDGRTTHNRLKETYGATPP
ncbi:hypothetical protein EYF80_043038 [Liparis tanakae]|uniref:Uncharacterized protein n=1 Tax=Liparis tanakae TaxID=230148 RepID=A0A4Z2G1G5_9TELE|nr:hypothetical protein EYF80_043038 [Liparis tanakae]